MFEPSFEIQQMGAAQVIRLTLPEMMDSREFDQLNNDMLGAVSTSHGGRWVLDLANLDYMGSSALGLLVNLRQRIQQSGGQLILCNITPPLMQILRTCCLERLFLITRTCEDALRRFR